MKYLITLITLVVLSVSGFAQLKSKMKWDSERFFRFGGKAGLNINKIKGQSYQDGYNYNYQLGAFLQFNFSNRFGLQPEVSFVQSSSEFSDDVSDPYNDLFRDGTQKNAKLNYLEIPLLLNINVGVSKHVKLQIGPAYGNVLKETVDSLKTSGNLFRKGEISAIGGLWIQLPVVNIGARYKMGLTDINKIKLDAEKWKTQSFQIFIGITL